MSDRSFVAAMAGLLDARDEPAPEVIEGERGWLPLSHPLPKHVRDSAQRITRTPAMLWDLQSLRRDAAELQQLFAEFGIDVNLAMKACSTVEVVRSLAELGIGADAASVHELHWARQAGFGEISACGPSFTPEDLPIMEAAGVVLDAVSLRQARAFLADERTSRLGLRLRVPLPSSMLSRTSRGIDSRFGVELTPAIVEEMSQAPAPIRSVRAHTGESNSANLAFRAAYAIRCADLLGTVETVNLGGGFLRLARQPDALRRVLEQVAPLLRPAGRGENPYRITVEPGGALMADHAYLVTDVLDVERHPHYGQLVTVDASAWNVAPWSKITFHHARVVAEPAPVEATIVAGPSLYEHDLFVHSTDEPRHLFPLGAVRVGERLVGTSVGSYTVTNGRSFHGMPIPAQYAVSASRPTLLRGPTVYTEQSVADRTGAHDLRGDIDHVRIGNDR